MSSRARIRIALAVGDALDQRADLAIVGSGPVLLERVERATGRRFAPLSEMESIRATPYHDPGNVRGCRILRDDSFVWRNTIAVSGRIFRDGRIRGAFHRELADLLIFAISDLEPRCVSIVPFHHTHSELLAAAILFHLWHYHAVGRRVRTGGACPELFRIVDRSDVDCFRKLLTGDRDRLYELIERNIEHHAWWVDWMTDSSPREIWPFELVEPTAAGSR